MPSPRNRNIPPDALSLAAATWLAAGIVLLGLTPLPLHDPRYGWSLSFWLLVAPAALLTAIRFTRVASPWRGAQAFAPVLLRSIRRRNSRMHAQVEFRAELLVLDAGVDRRVVVDLDHHRLVARPA